MRPVSFSCTYVHTVVGCQTIIRNFFQIITKDSFNITSFMYIRKIKKVGPITISKISKNVVRYIKFLKDVLLLF